MRPTRIFKVDPFSPSQEYIQEAVSCLCDGQVICLPTDTVYGLGCNYLSEKARERIYEIKGRSFSKPLAIAVYDVSLIENFIFPLPLWVYKVADNLLPGPLTVVLPYLESETLAFRIPSSLLCLRILEEFSNPIWLTSANRSGYEDCFSGEEVIKEFNGVVDLIIDEGETRFRQPSTVIRMGNEEIEIIRQGPITKDQLMRVVTTKNIMFVCTGNSCRSVMAEALFSKYVGKLRPELEGKIKCMSCGTTTIEGLPASDSTLEILKREEGIDFSTHKATECGFWNLKRQDVIFVAQQNHLRYIKENYPYFKDKVYLLLEYVDLPFEGGYDIPDPIGRSDEFYYRILALIKEAVMRLIRRL